jgi:hypothetical protein
MYGSGQPLKHGDSRLGDASIPILRLLQSVRSGHLGHKVAAEATVAVSAILALPSLINSF